MSGYQVMPRLTPDEYADLEASIVRDGVLVPIIVSSGGEIVDGHHRAEIARKHGIVCAEVVKSGDATELRTFAYSLNLNRRHLTREQKRDLIADSLRADPQLSNREHAGRTGASHPTVAGVRNELEADERLESFTSRTSADGRERPASQPERPVVAADDGAEIVEDEPTPAESKQRRYPLPEAFWQATRDLTKVSQRIERLVEDDRFTRNADEVATLYRSDLIRARDALQGVINRLPQP